MILSFGAKGKGSQWAKPTGLALSPNRGGAKPCGLAYRATGTGRPKGLPHGPPHNAERAMFSPSLTPPIVKLCCTPLPHSAERDSFYLTQCHEAPVVGPGVASSPLPTMAAPGLPERWPICQPDDTSKGCEEQQVEPGSTSPTRCSGPM